MSVGLFAGRRAEEAAEQYRREVYAKNAILRVWTQQRMDAFHAEQTRKAEAVAAGTADSHADTAVGFGV